MSDLPQGWEWTTLGDIATSVRNGIFVSRPSATPNGVPILRISSVRPMRLDLTDLRYCGQDTKSLRESEYLLSTGDLLFTRYSGSKHFVGACAYVPDDVGALTYPDKLIRARVPEVDCRYLTAAFASPAVRAEIEKVLRTTAGQVGISGSALKALPIPLAPLAEQHRIVAALELHLSHLEAGRARLLEAKTSMVDLLTSTLSALLADTHFEFAATGDLLHDKPINGRSVTTRPGGFPVLRLDAIKSSRVDLDESKDGDWSIEEAAPFTVQIGDFLVSRGNGSLTLVGRGGLVESATKPVAFPDTMIRLRLEPSCMDPRFFSIVWNSPKVRQQIEKTARTTAGIYKINQRAIRSIQIPRPSLSDQLRIVDRIDEIRNSVARLQSVSEAAKSKAERLRRSVLAEAFAGRLVRQDPRDEPASVLLDRIQAERAAQPKPRRSRSTTR